MSLDSKVTSKSLVPVLCICSVDAGDTLVATNCVTVVAPFATALVVKCDDNIAPKFDAIAFKRNAIPLFGKTVMTNLKKKIIEFRVKTIYLGLDGDATTDAVKLSDEFISNGIEVKMMKFEEKDPSETGFEKLLYLINRTNKTKFSDLMRIKLNGKTKRHMEI